MERCLNYFLDIYGKSTLSKKEIMGRKQEINSVFRPLQQMLLTEKEDERYGLEIARPISLHSCVYNALADKKVLQEKLAGNVKDWFKIEYVTPRKMPCRA